jgi:hypothetical protein
MRTPEELRAIKVKITDAMCKVVKTSLEVKRELLRFDREQDQMGRFIDAAPKLKELGEGK